MTRRGKNRAFQVTSLPMNRAQSTRSKHGSISNQMIRTPATCSCWFTHLDPFRPILVTSGQMYGFFRSKSRVSGGQVYEIWGKSMKSRLFLGSMLFLARTQVISRPKARLVRALLAGRRARACRTRRGTPSMQHATCNMQHASIKQSQVAPRTCATCNMQ